MITVIDLSGGNEASISASPKYRVTSKAILVSPIASTMFKELVAAVKEASKSKTALTRAEAQFKVKKKRAKTSKFKSTTSAISHAEGELVKLRNKTKHLISAVTAAKKTAGVTQKLSVKGSTIFGNVKGHNIPFKVVSQKTFDAAGK